MVNHKLHPNGRPNSKSTLVTGRNPKDCPPLDPDLVAHLERTFPDSLTRLDERGSDREIWVAYGKAAVVQYLRQQLEKQQNNILET